MARTPVRHRGAKTVKFAVIIPTWNRADTLAQAIDSVLAQTHKDWELWVLDDGSTDGTPELMKRYTDSRIHYIRFEENRGGVYMNEIGMDIAVRHANAWVRLGSDDWFEPEKLELDELALLGGYDACFGPYRNFPEVWTGELNVPSNPRPTLLQGSFAVSWANIAVRSWVLAEVQKRHGMFCDPRLRNMEDWLANTRIARFTEFAWRSLAKDRKRVIIGATAPDQVPFEYIPDAHYRVATNSATYGPAAQHAGADSQMTEKVINEDRAKRYPILELTAPVPRIVGWRD